jgi:putative transposase
MPAYPRKWFEDFEQARAWVQGFVTLYNTQHRHSGIQFVTLGQRRAGQDKEILQKRKKVYEEAKCSKPGRWKSRQTRNWVHVKEVWLNPQREHVGFPDKVAITV